MEEPMDLGPVLHLMHSFLPWHEFVVPESASRSEWVCSVFDRREVLSIQAALTADELKKAWGLPNVPLHWRQDCFPCHLDGA
jgi:hypothetical protein